MKRGSLLVVVVGISAALSRHVPAAREGKVQDPAHVWFTMDVFDGSISASFCRTGASMVGLGGNYRARPEIGHYEADLGRAPYDRLRALMQQDGFRAAEPSPPAPSGTRFVSIGETEDGKRYDMKGWIQGEIPPAVEPLIDEAVRYTESLFAHPMHVVRGAGAPAQARFVHDEPLAFRITLESVGTAALALPNPLSGDDFAARLQLVVARDVPSPQEHEVAWSDLVPADLFPRADDAPRAPEVVLAPGERFEFTVKRRVGAGPGPHRALLILRAPEPQAEEPFRRERVAGTLRIDLGSFEISGPEAR
jgi:hypothetical protein